MKTEEPKPDYPVIGGFRFITPEEYIQALFPQVRFPVEIPDRPYMVVWPSQFIVVIGGTDE